MKKITDLVLKNWLVIVLLVVIGVLLSKSSYPTTRFANQMMPFVGGTADLAYDVSQSKISTGFMPPIYPESAPVVSEDRLIVTNTNLSLKVDDVRVAIDKISATASDLGGFMVDSSLSVPEGAASGSISVRIPADKLSEGLRAIRSFGVKVVSENVYGTDVTSEYVDLEARLATLLKTKAKFEQILESSVRVEDLLNVNRELINLQSQIDALRGQQKYLEQTAKLALVTVYLSTDELALPYTPDEAWRPGVIFREAVRSLVGTVRGLGTGLIWLAVYSPVIVAVLVLVWWLRRRARG